MSWDIMQGDCLEQLAQMDAQSVHTCATSPPYYGLRDYGVEGQIGLEDTPDAYIERLVGVFKEVRRVLRDDGTVWLNLGDSYASDTKGRGSIPRSAKQLRNAGSTFPTQRCHHGAKPKDLLMIPARVALALQADGWYLRSDIIWAKPNPMPEPVTDRPTSAHEHIFLMAKQERYYYDADAIREGMDQEPDRRLRSSTFNKVQKIGHAIGKAEYVETVGRNRRNVWTVATQPLKEAHFAAFPTKLIEPCILAGCPKGGTVLDPFAGAGTTLLVADRHNRHGVGIELNPEYCALARRRLQDDCPLFHGIEGDDK